MTQPVSMGTAFLAELDREGVSTRRMLECVPEDKLSWRPHPKSWTMGELATHIANLLNWAVMTVETDSLDVGMPGGFGPKRLPAGSRRELLETFDQNTAAAWKAIAGTGDEDLLQPWSLLDGGRTVFTQPRIAVLKSMVVNHGIHHRGQLSVYLRLNDVPVPGMYGPTADEAPLS